MSARDRSTKTGFWQQAIAKARLVVLMDRHRGLIVTRLTQASSIPSPDRRRLEPYSYSYLCIVALQGGLTEKLLIVLADPNTLPNPIAIHASWLCKA